MVDGIVPNKIKKKYIPQKSKGILKKANKEAAVWLRRAGYVDTETIDYNNNTNVTDLKDTNTNNIDNINLKKT